MDYYIKPSQRNLSQRKREGYVKLAEIINWGRRNPVEFTERFLGLELLDYQKYVFTMSWSTPFVVWCMGRSSGKTTLGSPLIMTKSMLIPNFQAYIMAGVGSQAQEMFMKIEKIAKKEISSFTGLTDIFYNELQKSVANTDGFTHNPSGFKYSLFNASTVTSLNGSFDNNRSKRSNLNFYDESGFAPEDLFVASEPFCTQNADFRLGGDIDVTALPKQMPNQLIYASSASSIDEYFFKKYKEFAKRMFLGDKRYFVADINCEVVINATYKGKLYSVPLLSREKVETAMRDNKEKALREYYNIFATEGGDNQIIKRATIIRNSVVRVPKLYNDSNNKYGLAYDPARTYDNSIITAGEFINDEKVGWKLRIQNCVRLAEIYKSKSKSKKGASMRTPEQVSYIKQMILDYNGKAPDYENVELLVDSGAGGGGKTIGDYFMEDWFDNQGNKHKGLLDRKDDESLTHLSKFPNSSDKIRLLSPKKYKKDMFDALIEMMNLDLIEFTDTYDNKGELILVNNKEMENTYQDENGDMKTEIELDRQEKIYRLNFEEELALKNIDIAKEELVNIYRFDGQNENYRYDLPEDKKKKICDDRAYTLAMLAWRLQQLRRSQITNKPKPKRNLSTAPVIVSAVNL